MTRPKPLFLSFCLHPLISRQPGDISNPCGVCKQSGSDPKTGPGVRAAPVVSSEDRRGAGGRCAQLSPACAVTVTATATAGKTGTLPPHRPHPQNKDTAGPKLQALVYDILPSTTAVFSYVIGSRKLSANEQFFVGAQTVISLLQTTEIKQGVSFIAANEVYTSANKTTIV